MRSNDEGLGLFLVFATFPSKLGVIQAYKKVYFYYAKLFFY